MVVSAIFIAPTASFDVGDRIMKNVRNTTSNVLNTIFERGDTVEVVLASGETAERVVWEVVADLVYVCSVKTYERMQRGELAAQPIAFPIADVRALA